MRMQSDSIDASTCNRAQEKAKNTANGERTNSPPNALTASLCLHNSGGVVKYTQRMGTPLSWASEIHMARVAISALVLSAYQHVNAPDHDNW
jgi:hypothetical protein